MHSLMYPKNKPCGQHFGLTTRLTFAFIALFFIDFYVNALSLNQWEAYGRFRVGGFIASSDRKHEFRPDYNTQRSLQRMAITTFKNLRELAR